MSINALFPSGEAAHHARAPCVFPVQPLDHVVRADPPAVPVRELVQQVGRRLADALAQAVRGGLEPPGFHLRGDLFGLGQGGFPGHSMANMALRAADAHSRCVGGVFESTLRMKMPPCTACVSRLGQHRADRGDESGAPVADHQAHALQAAFGIMERTNCSRPVACPPSCPSATPITSRCPLRVDSDGDQDADVLHVPAP